jgi:hypothetical protein
MMDLPPVMDPPAIVEIIEDGGGLMADYFEYYEQLRLNGNKIMITGDCYSACTLFFTLPKNKICFSKHAVLGFHKASPSVILQEAFGSDKAAMKVFNGLAVVWTDVFWNFTYPEDIKKELGELTVDFKYIDGAELIYYHGYKECE